MIEMRIRRTKTIYRVHSVWTHGQGWWMENGCEEECEEGKWWGLAPGNVFEQQLLYRVPMLPPWQNRNDALFAGKRLGVQPPEVPELRHGAGMG